MEEVVGNRIKGKTYVYDHVFCYMYLTKVIHDQHANIDLW